MSTNSRPQRPLTRREVLLGAAAGLSGVGIAGACAAESGGILGRHPHFQPRVKRVIHLFMNGGPFQGDFFDPKPAINRFQGQRPMEVQLRTENATGGLLPVPYTYKNCGKSGLPVSDLLPHLSTVADELCVLRSLHTDNPNHGPALFMMNNGSITPTRPSMGAWMLYGLGSECEDLPGYVVLCPGRPVRFAELWSNGFLPGEYQGTYLNHSKLKPDELIPYLTHEGRNPDAQRRQLNLLQQLERAGNSTDEAFESRLKSMETAFRMQSAANDAFDISHEPDTIREEYGKTHFSNGCLMARRLVERGVRFVQVYYGNGQPWDTHTNHNDAVPKLAADIDRPMAALLRDLRRRGMLDDTLVIWGGEFGRTPTTEGSNGRDHNHFGFCMWMAGAGVRGGTSYGESDDFGFKASVDPVHVHDLHATLLHLMGMDHERLTFRHAGRDYRLTDVHGKVVDKILI